MEPPDQVTSGAQEETIPQYQQQYYRGPRYQLTPEEKAIMLQCRQESFWYRALPLSALAAAGVSYARRSGLIVPGSQIRTIFQYIGGITTGYFLGKISYISTCRQKIKDQLPNSKVAQLFGVAPVTQDESGSAPWSQHMASTDGRSAGPMPAAQPSGSYSRADEYRTMLGSSGGVFDSEQLQGESPAGSDMARRTSYDELRRRHRQQDAKKIEGGAGAAPPWRMGSGSDMAGPVLKDAPERGSGQLSAEPYSAQQPPEVNKYGDTIFKY